MKKQINIDDYHKYSHKAKTLLLVCMFLITLMLAVFTGKAADKKVITKTYQKELSDEIARQLGAEKLPLNFPLSVKRFYQQRQFNQNWIVKEADAGQTWAAMLMIDCVLQFGLNQADYHPNELLYSKLHDILERPGQVSLNQQARFEIMLTDAMLSFINNLHFGKFNPQYPASKIDKGMLAFDAIGLINKAMLSKDFMQAIVSAQPQNKLYQNLQGRMHIVAGAQLGDCYEFPEADVRKMALNMERLRWGALDTDNYIQVNVPSYKLSFYHKGEVDTFRVVVGKAGNPTPTLSSNIKYFTTAPEWKVPQKIFVKELLPKAISDTAYLTNNHYSIYNEAGMLINPNKIYLLKIKQAPQRYRATQSAGCDNALGQVVFRFANIYDIYLHDTPEQDFFYRKNRALSHGCIRVQNAAKLAKILLINDDAQKTLPIMEKALDDGIKKNFFLKKPIPIAVTYLTCEIVDGALIVYDDIYKLDNSLDMLLYKKDDQTLKITQN
ncbi:L,D-transpeptidase family protein [Mucilaginibacter sp.]|uniref:L,D-transpeptidase family protein n=1 Tax=Mucilaginibacter sp. TaxID=1882438 RepID=UPI00260BECBD|nr:L,D-transpeptidase family protein [Mucilaginibacter sp.]MDB5126181.1 L,D-transpeptidase family protein [Mucilaginibacter sp.]